MLNIISKFYTDEKNIINFVWLITGLYSLDVVTEMCN